MTYMHAHGAARRDGGPAPLALGRPDALPPSVAALFGLLPEVQLLCNNALPMASPGLAAQGAAACDARGARGGRGGGGGRARRAARHRRARRDPSLTEALSLHTIDEWALSLLSKCEGPSPEL